MTLRLKFSLLLLSLLTVSVAARALDRDAFTFTRYDLKLTVDPQKGTFEASGTVQLRNDSSAPQSNVALQVTSTLQWTSITSGDSTVPFIVQTYTSDIDHTGELTEAIATLPAPVPPRQTVTLRVAYRGTIPHNYGRLTRIGAPTEFANATEWDAVSQASTAVRGIGYVTWFPVSTTAANLSEGTTVLDTLGAWKSRHSASVLHVELVTPAVIPAPSVRWNTFKVSTCSAPASVCVAATFNGFSDTPTFVVAPFETLSRPLVDVSFRPEHAAFARDYAAALERWAPVQAEWLGVPTEKVQVIDLGELTGNPFDSGAFVFTSVRSFDRTTLEFALAHQLAHATLHSGRPWISEGIAHFMQAVVRESQAGRRAAITYMRQFSSPLIQQQKPASNAAPGAATLAPQPLITTNDPLFFRGKALFVWWMLRDMLGDAALQSALKSYRPDQDTQPAYMQSLLEKTSPGAPPRNLEWFFDDWVYRDRGLPDFRVDSAYPRKLLDGSFMVTVTVQNLGDAGAEVPVNVISAAGESSQRLIVLARSKAVVRIRTPQVPTRVTVNDGSVPESDTNNNAFEIKSTT